MVVYGIKIIAKVISVISVVSFFHLIAFPFIGMKMVKTMLYFHERTLSYFVMQSTWQQLLDGLYWPWKVLKGTEQYIPHNQFTVVAISYAVTDKPVFTPMCTVIRFILKVLLEIGKHFHLMCQCWFPQN